MHEIADRSGGQFFRAASDLDLRSAYATLACALTSAFALGQRLP